MVCEPHRYIVERIATPYILSQGYSRRGPAYTPWNYQVRYQGNLRTNSIYDQQPQSSKNEITRFEVRPLESIGKVTPTDTTFLPVLNGTYTSRQVTDTTKLVEYANQFLQMNNPYDTLAVNRINITAQSEEKNPAGQFSDSSPIPTISFSLRPQNNRSLSHEPIHTTQHLTQNTIEDHRNDRTILSNLIQRELLQLEIGKEIAKSTGNINTNAR